MTTPPIEPQAQKYAAETAFSKQAANFDEIEQNNPIVAELRRRIRQHVLSLVRTNETLLEINAGTGLDAVAFAQQGIRVTATDIAEGMLWQMRRKAEQYSLGEYLNVCRCSFASLATLCRDNSDTHAEGENSTRENGFDHIFSNFGGLNCAENLAEVIESLKTLVKPQGTVTLVIMPSVSVWEILTLLKGNTNALRRLRKGGTTAHVEGVFFPVYYYSPRYVKRAFGEEFECIELQGLAALAPPPHAERFAVRFPRAYRVLAHLDEMLSHLPLLRSSADHYLISFRNISLR